MTNATSFFSRSAAQTGSVPTNFLDQAGKMLLKQVFDGRNEMMACSSFVETIPHERAASLASNPMLDEDTLLVARLRRREPEAFEAMVRKFGGRMLATARRYFTCEDDARDALQEAFLSALKAIGTFKGESALGTWLHRIVVNAALMQLRTRRRRAEESIDDLLPQFDKNGTWIGEQPFSPASLGANLENSETRTMVRRCIARVPDSYRRVLILRELEDMDTDEVAATLELSPNAVKIRLHRARQALKTLIERERGENSSADPAVEQRAA
jgi:RNA polymerase sigma-70 factor (ECF subfamily)